jgi:LacI family transcriptional regulator
MGRQQRISQKAIAERLGLAPSTVSRSLNNEPGIGDDVRDMVLNAARELGYGNSGKFLQTASDILLTAIIPLEIVPSSASGLHQAIINAIESEAAARRAPYEAFFLHDQKNYANEIREICQENPNRRLLLVGLDAPDVIDAVVSANARAVIVNGSDKSMRVPGIHPANERAAYMACKHLIDLGHTNIAICSADYRSTLAARMSGFRQAMVDAGIDPAEKSCMKIDRVSWDLAYAAVKTKIERDGKDFTAILCGNDMVAIGAIKALKDCGYRVPEDCSVVGFDGVSAGAPAKPELTTIRIDCDFLGRQAVEMLLSKDWPEQIVDQVIACQLIQRQSTKPLD